MGVNDVCAPLDALTATCPGILPNIDAGGPVEGGRGVCFNLSTDPGLDAAEVDLDCARARPMLPAG